MLESKDFFVRYGDRTSSLLSLYPHFQSYTHEHHEGEIRYIEKSSVIGMANEPLCPETQKLSFIKNLLSAPEFAKKDKLIFPVSKSLASELKHAGMHIWQIGVEPIFNLNEYFGRNKDPLEYSPIARSLKKRRGVKVMALNEAEVDQYKEDIQELTEEALSQKKMAPLEFLNVIDPQTLEEYKRYFILRDRDMTVAVLTASPVYLNHQIIGYFFNDILKRRQARSASCDLLIIEAMRKLYEEGILEVRLGMCPLAEIAPEERNSKELGKIYSKWKLGYNFKNLYSFKMKLMPTSTRPLYLASDKPQFGRMLKNVYKLHSSKGFAKELTKRFWFQYKNNLELSQFTKSFTRLTKDKGLSFFYRIKWTLSFFTFYVSLHAFKVFTDVGEEFYDLSAYMPGDVTLAGIFAGPMFHNHAYHIIGDQLSFLVFAGALEFTFGAFFMLMIKAIGLWLSNPVTHLFLAFTLKYVSPFWWEQVLSEKDWGTSNAVFALVGACLFVLKKSTWLYLPFIFHAIFICFQRESFLAIHHITGLTLGYMFAAFYFAYKIKSEGSIEKSAFQST